MEMPGRGRGNGFYPAGGFGGRINVEPGRQVDISKSTLSADAPVFVPRSYQPVLTQPQIRQPQPQPQLAPPRSYGAMDRRRNFAGFETSASALEQVKQCISLLTSSPGSLDDIIRPLSDSLNKCILNEETLMAVAEEIFKQAVLEPNFRYTGARLCYHFSQQLQIEFQHGNFQDHLLNRCKQEHQKRKDFVEHPQMKDHLEGFTLFMGELLLSMSNGSQPSQVLVGSVRDLVVTLLESGKDSCLRCVVQVLKLTGATLEDSEKGTGQDTAVLLDAVLNKLKQVILDEALARDIKSMLLSVVELRAKNWGRLEAEKQLNGALQNNIIPSQGGVMYGSSQQMGFGDGDYMSSNYMDGNDMYWPSQDEDYFDYMDEYGSTYSGADDEFDDEIAAAFEEFMRENESQQQQQQQQPQQQYHQQGPMYNQPAQPPYHQPRQPQYQQPRQPQYQQPGQPQYHQQQQQGQPPYHHQQQGHQQRGHYWR